jgi:RNA polymerase sigma-70 factor, ECF subfamily
MLRRLAIGLCRDGYRADDLVQETMARALANRSSFTPGTNFSAWLTVILRNFYFTSLRRSREAEDPDDVRAKAMPCSPTAQRLVEARELLELVDSMPIAFKEPLLLAADGASLDEIAFEMRERLGTIKSRMSRARGLLKALG